MRKVSLTRLEPYRQRTVVRIDIGHKYEEQATERVQPQEKRSVIGKEWKSP